MACVLPKGATAAAVKKVQVNSVRITGVHGGNEPMRATKNGADTALTTYGGEAHFGPGDVFGLRRLTEAEIAELEALL